MPLCWPTAGVAGRTFFLSRSAVGLLQLGSQWSVRWQEDAVKRAGIFCYRGVVRRLLGAETA